MKAYNTLNGYSCYQLAQAFINSWDETLAYDGYSPGVYAPTCAANIAMFANVSYVPAAIASADNLDDPMGVYGLRCLDDTLWNNNQRIHQLADSGGGGGYPVTPLSYNGSSTFYVDEDCVDGPLEGPTSYSPSDCGYYY